jgi:Protein of unknown function (DUF3592)
MARTKRPIKWTVGAVIVLLAALGLFALSISLTVREYQLGANGVPALGTVTMYEKRGRSVYWTISYLHQGQPVSATVVPSMFSGLELNQEVAILYDPKDPKTINVNRFWHRYFYQTLSFGLGVLFLCVLPSLLWQSDEAWLREYITKPGAAAPEDQPRPRVDQWVVGFWQFDLSACSVPRGAIADYFRTYGLPGWSALKAAWDRDAVPSLAPVLAEIDRVIAGRDPTQALADASPDIEKFYYPHRAAILQELRDYATDPNRESTPNAESPRDQAGERRA